MIKNERNRLSCDLARRTEGTGPQGLNSDLKPYVERQRKAKQRGKETLSPDRLRAWTLYSLGSHYGHFPSVARHTVMLGPLRSRKAHIRGPWLFARIQVLLCDSSRSSCRLMTPVTQAAMGTAALGQVLPISRDIN